MEEYIPNSDRRVICITTSYHPQREVQGHPYHLDTCEGHRPRQRWYPSYEALGDAVKRANPGKIVREET